MPLADVLGGVTDALGNIFNPIAGIANFGLQLGNQNYQRNMQRQSWEREDTAVQRRAADMKAAGINPLLAAGAAAQSSSPIQIGAPQISENIPQAMLALKSGKQNIAQSAAEIERINQLTKGIEWENLKASEEDRAWKSLLPNAGVGGWKGEGFFLKKQMEANQNQISLDTMRSVYDKAVADAESSRTNADALARDLQIAKDRKIPFVNLSTPSSQTADLGNIFSAGGANGFLKGAGLQILQNLLGGAADIGGKAVLKGAPLGPVMK